MVEGIKKSPYMPKQGFLHGGEYKEIFVYAQTESEYVGGGRKISTS
jgi:hypothetical protein